MKILHLMLGCFYIDNYSYQENYLPKHHRLLGHDVEIIASLVTFDETGKSTLLPHASKYTNEDNIPVTRLDYRAPKGLSKKLRYYVGLKDELERIAPDTIFVHGVQFSDISIVVSYIRKNVNTKVYVDNHSDFSNSATNWISKHILHRIWWRHCAKKIEPYTTRFYGVLPARVDFLQTVYDIPANKTSLLVMGADDELVKATEINGARERIRLSFGISEEDFLIVTGGKIDAFKTQTLLLMEAVQKIKNPKVKLLVFGSVTNELRDKLLALTDCIKVKYIGWIPARESYDYFSAADLAVFPGRHSVFWEQVVAQGIPMIAKYWKGTTHVDCGGNVVFLKEDSIEELEDAILSVLDKKVYQHMKERASMASKNFLYSNIAKISIDE